MSTPDAIQDIDLVYRRDARRVFATLVRLLGDFDRKRPVPTTLAPNRRWVYWRAASPGCQRVGSNSSMRLFGCMGKRVSTSVR